MAFQGSKTSKIISIIIDLFLLLIELLIISPAILLALLVCIGFFYRLFTQEPIQHQFEFKVFLVFSTQYSSIFAGLLAISYFKKIYVFTPQKEGMISTDFLITFPVLAINKLFKKGYTFSSIKTYALLNKLLIYLPIVIVMAYIASYLINNRLSEILNQWIFIWAYLFWLLISFIKIISDISQKTFIIRTPLEKPE